MAPSNNRKNQSVKGQPTPKPTASKVDTKFDFHTFSKTHFFKTVALFAFLFILFLISIFKNISYPLFWADESMTIVGAERVLKYGYPKVHDGKNVFYDLRHTNPTLGIDPETDAYIGGTSWGHYYFATIGAKLAEGMEDIYQQTAIVRITFALAGLAGLIICGWCLSGFFTTNFSKFSFACLFTFFSILSVSLVLALREVRYYSLTILLVSTIIGIYGLFRFRKRFNIYLFAILLSASLWALFNTFAPVFFICLLTIGLTETVIALHYLIIRKSLKDILMDMLPVVIAIAVAFISILPLLTYFKTFEISQAMAVFNNYSSKMYAENVSTVFKYFKTFELFWLAVVLRVIVLINTSKLYAASDKFKMSNFLTLFFIVFVFAIARIPNFIYTRYIIYLQPVLSLIIIFDLFTLLQLIYKTTDRVMNIKSIAIFGLVIAMTGFSISKNSKYIQGHISELVEQYKGPLDYTIPFIKEKYKNTENLVIATNYEETSYMYYLKAKVVVGFIGNNLEEDAKASPDIIAYRKLWGNHIDVFQNYMKNQTYSRVDFPCYDNPVNNIPELNFMPAFNHQFKSVMAKSEQEKTELYLKN